MPAEPPEEAQQESGHDDTGLSLARSVARGLAGAAGAVGAGRRPRRTRQTPSGRAGSARHGPAAGSSGSHPDERDPQLLDTTISRLVADQGWDADVRVHGVFTRWAQVVGAEVAAHCHPESYADGRLVVRADSTAWATQVRLLAPTVVRRLNEELGDGSVSVVDVRGPAGPSWKRGPRSVRGRGPRDTYG